LEANWFGYYFSEHDNFGAQGGEQADQLCNLAGQQF
jgi:hypothetical protein